jgi:hypothetical protein
VGSRHIAITDMGVYDAVNAATRLKYEPYDYSGAAVAEASALGTATLRPCWPRASMTAHRLPPTAGSRCSAISRITTARTVRPGCLACRRRQRRVAGIPRGRSPRFRNAQIRRSLIRHWQSLWNAPNFPSYVSDHSAFSAAAAAALEDFSEPTRCRLPLRRSQRRVSAERPGSGRLHQSGGCHRVLRQFHRHP